MRYEPTGHDDIPLVRDDDGTLYRWNKLTLSWNRVPTGEGIRWQDIGEVLALVLAVILVITGVV